MARKKSEDTVFSEALQSIEKKEMVGQYRGRETEAQLKQDEAEAREKGVYFDRKTGKVHGRKGGSIPLSEMVWKEGDTTPTSEAEKKLLEMYEEGLID